MRNALISLIIALAILAGVCLIGLAFFALLVFVPWAFPLVAIAAGWALIHWIRKPDATH